MKKLTITLGLALLAAGAVSWLSLTSEDAENERSLASAPPTYESLTGCQKQSILWKNIQATAYAELPKYAPFGLSQLLKMGAQEISLKSSRHSDFAPAGWVKHLHRRAAIAKVKIIPTGGKYTGVFQGADCGILRLSLTYATSRSRPVAPGLALKIHRDGVPAANISALVSLDGQGDDFNFFRNPMSNIVPVGGGFGQRMVHGIFSRVSKYPEELGVKDLASVDAAGVKTAEVRSPRQIFFVPGTGIGGPSEAHDVRSDFLKLKSGTVVYRIYAAPAQYASFDYSKYSPELAEKILKESDPIAEIVTTSEFVASSFGDDGIFFRHQVR